MAVTSEAHQEFEKAQALRKSLRETSSVNRSGRVFLGSILIISALGLWLVPVADGDAGMRLIKLLISLVLMGLGAMFLSSIDDRGEAPEIEIDVQGRELRVLKADMSGQMSVVSSHSFDSLTDVTLKDKLLTARSAAGELLLSVPVTDKHTEKALRAALQEVA
ncbi:hypothetical protein [Roseovarius sp. 2305UL8-3]|uniref:hypothetical protein n=1 Tax=Roseovarius conchicola TaxID=3121636 RepID=UPI003527DC94